MFRDLYFLFVAFCFPTCIFNQSVRSNEHSGTKDKIQHVDFGSRLYELFE